MFKSFLLIMIWLGLALADASFSFTCIAADHTRLSFSEVFEVARTDAVAAGEELTDFICDDFPNLEILGSFPTNADFYGDNYKSLTNIKMVTSSMTGTLPAALFESLTALESLELTRFVSAHGPIPTEIGLLKNLSTLLIVLSGYTGTMPAELNDLPLKNFRLEETKIVGNLTKFLTNPSLRTLRIDTTPSFGTLPTELFREDISFILQNNLFSGSIPDEISIISAENDCILQGNRFHGTLPAHTCNSGFSNAFIFPTESPTVSPPTVSPTRSPTAPTTSPTTSLTNSPTAPTTSPTTSLTNSPTAPTTSPTSSPTHSPTASVPNLANDGESNKSGAIAAGVIVPVLVLVSAFILTRYFRKWGFKCHEENPGTDEQKLNAYAEMQAENPEKTTV